MIDFNYTAPELLPLRIQEVLGAPDEPHRIGGVVYVPEDGGECEMKIDIDMNAIRCSKCGYKLPFGTDLGETRFCGGCGRRVKR